MSPLEDQVIDQFVQALDSVDGMSSDLAAALRAELVSPKGPNAEKLADLIRNACEGPVA